MKKLERKTRDEKRRLQLNKANSQAVAIALEKAQGLNKRVLAVVVAVAIVLGLLPLGWFVFRGRAEEISSLGSVTMSVRANSAENYTTATIKPGNIADNVSSADFRNELPNGVEYYKAVMVDANTGTETDIETVGAVVNGDNETVYYGIERDSNSGTLLKEGQSLVLVMAAKYDVSVTANNHGTITTSAITEDNETFIWGGNNLRIQATPDTDYVVDSITYTVNGQTRTATVSNNAATIPANVITGDIAVTVHFAQVSAYTISEVQSMSSSKYYPEWVGKDNQGGITTGTGPSSQDHEGANPVAPGGTSEFYLYSKSNTGGDTYVINMLSVNGVDLAYPVGTTVGASETTPFKGGTATVELVDTDAQLDWNGDKAFLNQKYRTLYKITITDVHEDLEVAFNFKLDDERQIIIRGLHGIQSTGYSVENQNLLDRYYTLTRNNQNMYTSYYTWGDSSGSSWYPSNNLLLYTVKPGYNPYNVTTEMSYDGGPKTSQGIRDNTAAGNPETVIANAGNAGTGRYNTSFRYWGKNTTLNNTGEYYRASIFSSGTKLLLTEISEDTTNDWYAVALAQNASYDQQLFLNAIPYNYSLQLETGTGTLNATGYTPASISGISGNVYLENADHTVEDAHAYIVTPSETPVWDADHVFQGWQLVDASGEAVSGIVYQSNSQVPLTEDVISHAFGDVQGDDLAIRLQAIWQEISHADTTTVSVEVYHQTPSPDAGTEATIGGKTYQTIVNTTETQAVGEETALVNAHAPSPSKYYELNPASILETTTVSQESASVIPEENQLKAIYDLKLYNFSLKKELFGRTKYSNYEITLRLTRPNDYPLSVQDAASLIDLADDTGVTRTIDNNTILYTNSFSNGETLEFSGIPYGWSYEVVETEQQGDNCDTYITSIASSGKRTKQEGKTFTGTVAEDTDLVVTNQRASDDPNIVSDKWLTKNPNGDTYDLTMETYSIGATITDTATEAVPMDIALVIDQSGSMGTQDVNPSYHSTGVQDWTVEDAMTGHSQYGTYYYKVGDKYYPVQAQEGQLYEAVNNPIYVQQMKGLGHDDVSLGANGSPVHYNVPTNYYTVDPSGHIHKIWLITVGDFLDYSAWAYYYTDNDTPKEIVTDVSSSITWGGIQYSLVSSNVLVNEENPYNNGAEWTENIYWAGLSFDHDDFFKSTESIIRNHYTSDYVTNATLFSGSYKWRSLAANGQVAILGRTGATRSDMDATQMAYSWISNGSNVNSGGDVYLPKDGTNYNALYYVDDNGDKVPIGEPVDIADGTAYHGELYFVQGDKTRLEALQEAVTDFTEKVAQNAKETGADHRIGIIGFAGNEVPGRSTGETTYDSTIYDYTDTGLFLNNDFKNYETITGYTQTSDRYINRHYYILDGSKYVPVFYNGGNWYRLDTLRSVASNTTFYAPTYADLTASDYQDALVDASKKDGGEYNGVVNDNLTDAIENFGHYGGTYTSYGVHMANELFENNTQTYEDSSGETKQRRRLIIVFTDGEPGAYGYDTAIAGEALVDGNRATYALDDGGLGATVYTIGLFPGNTTSQVQTFMNQLSSAYTLETTSVYAAANVLDGGTRNAGNNFGAGALDPSETYYYTGSEGKTYAVEAQRDGLSTLGWWNYNNGVYTRAYPKNASNDARDINGIPVSTFYNSSGNAVYEENLQPGTTYYTTNNRNNQNDSTALRYEYRWYDSNNNVVEPKTTENGQGTQFLALGSATANQDGKQYYYEVKETAALTDAFVNAFETIMTASSKLEPMTSLIRDVVSDNFDFDASDNPRYTVEIIPGEQVDENSAIVFHEEDARDATSELGIDWSDNDKTISVTGFDFSEKYIAPTHQGEKVRITLYGLKPTQTGGIFESNAPESGVCRFMEDNEGQITDEFKLIDAFPNPSISRYEYAIDVDGDDTTATYGTTFTLLDADGDPLANNTALLELMKHSVTSNGETWDTDPGTIQNQSGSQAKSIIFEEIQDVDQFEVLLDDGNHKHGDAIPDDYQIRYTVTGTDMDDVTYDYTKRIDGGAETAFNDDSTDTTDGNPFTRIMARDDDTTVHISSDELTTTVTIQEITQAADPSNDFSDPTKEFDVKLVLKDRNGDPVADYENGPVQFDGNGRTTIPMKHQDSVTFEIPIGYRLEIDVDENTQDGYVDSYRENGVDKEGSSYSSGAINAFTSIQVINTNDAPTITGFFDNEKSFGILLGVVGGISLAAAAGYVYLRRRKYSKN